VVQSTTAQATGYPAEQANGERQRVALSRTDFVVLIHEHAPALYRIAYRLVGDAHDAEDVVQETLRSAWKSRESFTCGRGQRAWLAAILRRRVIDRWRRAGRRLVLVGEGPLEVPVRAVDPTTNDFTDEMQQALSQLPSELRESLLLVVVGELTHQETADALGVPLGTVLSRVSRARQRLRKHLVALSHA
jgi:RNA polymerase sigma-70 factor, ECF subfamily